MAAQIRMAGVLTCVSLSLTLVTTQSVVDVLAPPTTRWSVTRHANLQSLSCSSVRKQT